MYSGTTLRKGSGRIVGVHQRIDRIARLRLYKYISKTLEFPSISDILKFEGKNGPDGLKLKSPSRDEPRHFIDPTDSDDHMLLDMIHSHIKNLAEALKADNHVRASFEAAWLAHAVVDGLTPPHHYPLTEKTRKSYLKKGYDLLKSKKNKKEIETELSRRQAILKKWEFWGTRSATSHVMFEWGVASVTTTSRFTTSGPADSDIERLKQIGYDALFMESVHKVYDLQMFDEFEENAGHII